MAEIEKYQRKLSKTAKHAKDKKLRSNLKSLESKFHEAAKSAAQTEYLLLENKGFLEAEGELEKTFKVRQTDIKQEVDVSTQKKAFNLDLVDFGPYNIDYSRSGNHLLLGGQKGHIASFDWKQGILGSELNVNETVRAVKWLQNDNQFFAAAQKKYTYIYDQQGTEIHVLKNHIEATRLEYLPYHYLLVSAGNTGYIKYQDVSTGQLVAELRTKLGSTVSMTQNPYNAIIHAGHSNGTVTLWAPSMSTPLVKLLSSRGPVRALAVDRAGKFMAVAGEDKSLKIWDIRNYKELHSYYTPTVANSLDISDTGLVAVGWGPHVQIWKDILRAETKESAPYMNHLVPGSQISSVWFVPFEDILGAGHAKGFQSLIVPGSGEANFDSLEMNPYYAASREGRREAEVKSLLTKLQPDMISLNPDLIGTVDGRAAQQRLTAAEIATNPLLQAQQQDVKMEVRPTVKARNSTLRRHLRKKTANVIDERKKRIEAALEKEKQLRRQKRLQEKGEVIQEKYGPALKRFV